jgi:phage shock protein A
MKHINTFNNFINESSHSEKLEREFKKLNAQYIKLDKKMDSLAKTGNTDEISDQLEKIQLRMSEISTELESIQ